MNVEDLANRISLPHLVSFFLDAKGHVWAIAITLHLPSVVSRLALFIFHIGTNLAEMIFVFYKYSVHLDQAKKKRGQHEQFWFCLSETWKNVLLWNYWANWKQTLQVWCLWSAFLFSVSWFIRSRFHSGFSRENRKEASPLHRYFPFTK